ncbi:MAG TPA: zinc ribbon domain-containing protein [Solirubrobacterales bacterium]|jgi:hypothetical protein
MAATQQPPPAAAWPPGQPCPSCGAPLAADQRYCLSCGTRRGEPRVTPAAASAPAPGPEAAASPPGRPADVSPLAAVIGIALLGGMLLIGVLIGRGGANDEPAPAPVIQVGEGTTTATSSEGGGTGTAAVTSEWPQGTDGFTIQLTTVSKDGATTETVDAAKQKAVSDGAADAAVLDSDLYASLPPGNYVIYSGVYTDRRSAEVALKGLRKSFPSAAVVEVSSGGGAPATGGDQPPATDSGSPGAVVPGAGGESEVPPGTGN